MFLSGKRWSLGVSWPTATVLLFEAILEKSRSEDAEAVEISRLFRLYGFGSSS